MRPRSRRGPGALFLLAWLALATPLHAAPPARPLLVVTRTGGAEECPDAAALSAAVTRMIGRPAFSAAPSPEASESADTVTVEIARGGLYTAAIHSAGAERDLSDPGPGCAALADALTVTLAILLDPEGQPLQPKPEVPAPRETPHPVPALRPPSPARARVATLEIAGAGATGVVSGVAPAVAGEIDLRPSPLFSITVGAFVAPAHTWSFPPGDVRLAFVGGSLRPCAPEIGRQESLRLRLCAELLAGGLNANPSGLGKAQAAQEVFWIGGGPHVHLDGRIAGPLGWAIRAGALYARPQHFVVGPSPALGVPAGRQDLPSFDFLFGAGLRLSIF